MRNGVLIGAAMWAALGFGCAAWSHGTGFTPDENAWFNRRRAVDGTKCCDENDAFVGENVEWRMVGGRYEVFVRGAWYQVPPGRVMRSDPADPSPFGSAALLFYTVNPNWPNGFMLWCFRPGILL